LALVVVSISIMSAREQNWSRSDASSEEGRAGTRSVSPRFEAGSHLLPRTLAQTCVYSPGVYPAPFASRRLNTAPAPRKIDATPRKRRSTPITPG
jgi:hypothetical protein